MMRSMTRSREILNLAIGSAFGLGLAPIAPGSFGALLGVLFHLLVALYLPLGWQTVALVSGLLAVSAANNVLTPWAVEYWKDEDPRHFVLDEIAGYLVVPILFRGGDLFEVILWGFLLFRIFDIVKIPPARQIDRQWHGKWGILLDDIVSGTYAALALYALAGLGVLSSQGG
jgi:phosphatidylglycerophosphatase A